MSGRFFLDTNILLQPLRATADFFFKTGQGVFWAQRISLCESAKFPEVADHDCRMTIGISKFRRFRGTPEKDDKPVLPTCTKEKVGILVPAFVPTFV
jgi:hypothetical protein